MTNDLVDRVDREDKVIGTTTKDEAHVNGYIHRVSAVFVFDREGKLLVQLRKKGGLLDHSAAGHVDCGESYGDAAMRELNEELGIVRNDLVYLGKVFEDSVRNNVKHLFGVYKTLLGNDQMKLEPSEVIDMIPMEIPEIITGMQETPEKFTPGFMYTLNFYVENKGLQFPKIEIR